MVGSVSATILASAALFGVLIVVLPQVEPVYLAISVLIFWVVLYSVFWRIRLVRRILAWLSAWRKRTRWLRASPEILKSLLSAIDAEMKLLDTTNAGAIERVVSDYMQLPDAVKRSYMIDSEFRGIGKYVKSYKSRLSCLKGLAQRLEERPNKYRSVLEVELRELVEELIIFHNDFYELCNDTLLKQLRNLGVSCSSGNKVREGFVAYKTNLKTAFERIQNLQEKYYETDEVINPSKRTMAVKIMHIHVAGREPTHDLPP